MQELNVDFQHLSHKNAICVLQKDCRWFINSLIQSWIMVPLNIECSFKTDISAFSFNDFSFSTSTASESTKIETIHVNETYDIQLNLDRIGCVFLWRKKNHFPRIYILSIHITPAKSINIFISLRMNEITCKITRR